MAEDFEIPLKFWNSFELPCNCSHKIFEFLNIFSACLLMIFKWLTGKKIIILHLCVLQDWEQEDTPWDTTPIIHRHLVRNKMGRCHQFFSLKSYFISIHWRFHIIFLKQRTLVVDKGQIISKGFLMSSISSKKQTKEFDYTTMIPQIDLFSFVFWRKSKTPKNDFEIIWPLRLEMLK